MIKVKKAEPIQPKGWERLPDFIKTDEIEEYRKRIYGRQGEIVLKRVLDVYISLLLITLLSPVMLAAAVAVAAESPGGILFRQRRVTQYGKKFEILKFRTMLAEQKRGTLITAAGDDRITKVGRMLRRTKMDELPQLFNVLAGDMSLVGVRPEVERFVDCYTPEMMATLLLPAGMTSPASLVFREEEKLLWKEEDVEKAYREKLLPQKMELNLEYIRNFSLAQDIKIILKTAAATLEFMGKTLCGRKKYAEVPVYNEERFIPKDQPEEAAQQE